MELQRRHEADDAFGHKRRGFGQCAAGIGRPLSELVKPPRGPDDNSVPNQARQRLWANTVGGEVFQPHHGAGAQQFDGVGASGGSRSQCEISSAR